MRLSMLHVFHLSGDNQAGLAKHIVAELNCSQQWTVTHPYDIAEQ